MNSSNIGRNDPCPCGSGRKFKKCCGPDDPQLTRARVAGPDTQPPMSRHLVAPADPTPTK
ncbi:MAG: SEC-C metal-binding domain-containing protein [Terriglobales bacterium]